MIRQLIPHGIHSKSNLTRPLSSWRDRQGLLPRFNYFAQAGRHSWKQRRDTVTQRMNIDCAPSQRRSDDIHQGLIKATITRVHDARKYQRMQGEFTSHLPSICLGGDKVGENLPHCMRTTETRPDASQ